MAKLSKRLVGPQKGEQGSVSRTSFTEALKNRGPSKAEQIIYGHRAGKDAAKGSLPPLPSMKRVQVVPTPTPTGLPEGLQVVFKAVVEALGGPPGTRSLTTTEKLVVLAAVRSGLVPPPTVADEIEPPEKAPELWINRDLNLRENAPQFIARVYAPWLGKGLQRKHLKAVDPELYKALSVWIGRHPSDPILKLLPARHDVLDDVIDELRSRFPLQVLRRLGHAIDSRMKRDPNFKA